MSLELHSSLHQGVPGKILGGGGCLVSKSCLTLVTSWTIFHQVPLSMDFPGKNTGEGNNVNGGNARKAAHIDPETQGKTETISDCSKPHS